MPNGSHQTQLDLPIERVWGFVSSINNWAPLVPGYINHELINDSESTWEFEGDLGFMKKKIKLKVDITEWRAPNLVTFNLSGLSENFSGDGYFDAEKIDENSTKMTGYLDITAHGAMSPMINKILKKFVPKTTEKLTISVANRMKEVAGERA
ncbi:CoxG family protein [Oceanobacillus sp. AG]|uniref:CoxG family protein n=1 Tax=Oceanobacillus sp. AG TaxID=2681969 RepID=UPI0012EC99C4|nr:SRPBCC family protein [Oceanobacillus sp. AG]